MLFLPFLRVLCAFVFQAGFIFDYKELDKCRYWVFGIGYLNRPVTENIQYPISNIQYPGDPQS